MLRSRTSFDRDSTFRRARPLLGTMVEITLCHDDQAAARVACERAFQAVAAIDAFMSYHRRESELSRLNGTPPGVPCDVSLHTWRVLARAASVHLASGGLFDCTVAPCLEDRGFLPRWREACDRDGTQDDVLLPEPGRVVKRRRVRLDLGGIAKGYAVDCAVEALRAAGVPAGCVNAGGDIRSFGAHPLRVEVRDPAQPGRSAAAVEIEEAAVATTAGYFSRRSAGGCGGRPPGRGRHRDRPGFYTPVVDPRAAECVDLRGSVTVAAAECVVADALTKVVALSGDTNHPALARFRAEAWILPAVPSAARR